MRIEVDGMRLFFDVEGPALVPRGREMKLRPTVVLVHGGPGGYDHSYFKPHFGRLAAHAQVVYLDLPGHGRSDWGDPADWSFERCADAVRGFCDAVGIERPIVLGHSLGGPVALLYGARHAGHAAGLGVLSGFARYDLSRIANGFRQIAGDEIAELARRSYGGDPVSAEEWVPIFAAFGPNRPHDEQLSRRRQNLELAPHGMHAMRRLDIVGQLAGVTSPVLVCVGDLDPVTPVSASEEVAQALPAGLARLEVLEGAGHFPWLDVPERYWALLGAFVAEVSPSA